MANEQYFLFSAGLFGLIAGFFGMSTAAAFALGALFGLLTVGTVGFVILGVVFLLSFLGSALCYLWFIAALEE